MRVQLAPPSVERNRPDWSRWRCVVSGTKPRWRARRTDSGLGFESASTIRYTVFGALGATATPARPHVVVGRPLPVIGVQVSPPSMLFHRPEPRPPLWR